MSERGMFPDAIAPRDGRGHVVLANFNRTRQIRVRCQRRHDGRRIRAAGAVGQNALDERRAQQQFRPTVKKNVRRIAQAASMSIGRIADGS